MATDEEAFAVFKDLFQPIIKDLHPDFDFRQSYKFEDFKPDLVQEKLDQMHTCLEKISDFKLEVDRNFKGTPFTPLMTKEAKLQVERKCVEVLGSLYGKYE